MCGYMCIWCVCVCVMCSCMCVGVCKIMAYFCTLFYATIPFGIPPLPLSLSLPPPYRFFLQHFGHFFFFFIVFLWLPPPTFSSPFFVTIRVLFADFSLSVFCFLSLYSLKNSRNNCISLFEFNTDSTCN